MRGTPTHTPYYTSFKCLIKFVNLFFRVEEEENSEFSAIGILIWTIKRCHYLLDVITSSLGSPAYSRKLRYLPKIRKKPPNFMDAS